MQRHNSFEIKSYFRPTTEKRNNENHIQKSTNIVKGFLGAAASQQARFAYPKVKNEKQKGDNKFLYETTQNEGANKFLSKCPRITLTDILNRGLWVF